MYRAKKWAITLSAGLFLLAWWQFQPLAIYATLLLIAGLTYGRHLIARWATLLLTLPLVAIAAFQMYRRVYYAWFYGGEGPSGEGSPLAFLVGFAVEIPIYVILLCAIFAFRSDFKSGHFRPEPNDYSTQQDKQAHDETHSGQGN